MARTVNLTELAELLGVSGNTLREVLRKHDAFPVLSRGSNGVPYEFDADAAAAWWRQNAQAASEAEAARRQQLAQMRLELFGEAAGEAAAKPLSPAERKAELEAQVLEDKLRRARGALVEREQILAGLAAAMVALRNELMQVPTEFARARGLDREARIALEAMIERRLGDLAKRLSRLDVLEDLLDAAA